MIIINNSDKFLKKRILNRRWKLDTRDVFNTFSGFGVFDYAILLYGYENACYGEVIYFKKTEVMRELNLLPNNYNNIVGSIEKLLDKGFLCSKCISDFRIEYALSEKGIKFCELLISFK